MTEEGETVEGEEMADSPGENPPENSPFRVMAKGEVDEILKKFIPGTEIYHEAKRMVGYYRKQISTRQSKIRRKKGNASTHRIGIKHYEKSMRENLAQLLHKQHQSRK